MFWFLASVVLAEKYFQEVRSSKLKVGEHPDFLVYVFSKTESTLALDVSKNLQSIANKYRCEIDEIRPNQSQPVPNWASQVFNSGQDANKFPILRVHYANPDKTAYLSSSGDFTINDLEKQLDEYEKNSPHKKEETASKLATSADKTPENPTAGASDEPFFDKEEIKLYCIIGLSIAAGLIVLTLVVDWLKKRRTSIPVNSAMRN
jgi:hypothetical protein